MPAPKSTDQTGSAQGRFTMSLPDSTGKALDKIAATIADAVEAASGVRVNITRPQVVESLVTTELKRQAENGAGPSR